MRFLVLGPGHPFRGGIARTTTELVLTLRRRGHDVSFLTPKRQYGSILYPGGAERDPGACPGVPGARRVLDPLRPWSWTTARRAARGAEAEAWIAPYWTWAWAPLLGWILRAPNTPPKLLVVHNLEDHDAGRRHQLASRHVLKRADGLLTHAEALARELRSRYPGRPVASHLLPPCTMPSPSEPEAARRRLGLPLSGRLALFLGLIRPYKGVDLLLDAVGRLPEDTDWHVVVAGEAWGGLDRELERRAREEDISGRVTLRTGWVPEHELATLLAAADLVVLPYRSGSQSAVAPQALAAGVPVLSTMVGGLPELIRDGVNGRLVPPNEPSVLATALSELDREQLDRLARGASETAARLTWDDYAATVERLIERIGS